MKRQHPHSWIGSCLVALGVFGIAGVSVDAPAAPPSSGPGSARATEADRAREAAPSATRAEIDALRAELRRGLDGLRLPDAPVPYAARLRLVRGYSFTVSASYGAVALDVVQHIGQGRVQVHVGTRTRDETGFFGADGSPNFALPLHPDPETSRFLLWRSMDPAYRAAVAQYTEKGIVIEQLAEPPTTPDHAAAPEPVDQTAAIEGGVESPLSGGGSGGTDRAAMGELVAALSARFAEHPDVDDGEVMFEIARTYETTIETESGFESADGETPDAVTDVTMGERRERGFVAVVADARAADGMQLDHGAVIHFDGTTPPGDLRERGEAIVDRVLTELEELRVAPMMDEDYDGPVLFESEAAAQLLASLVAVHGGGEPAPLSEWGRVMELEPHWAERLGKSVLPDHLGLIDDPTAPGFGHYVLDGEGVPGQRVEMVRDGVLRELLMTRRPNEHIDHSNGHARVSTGIAAGPGISNLRLTSKKRGLSPRALEAELLRRAREDGYEYAYVIETLRDGNVLGPVPRDTAQLFGAGRKVSLPIPGRLVRLGRDGSRTLIRGALIAPVSMRALRRIRAHGRQWEVHPMRIAPGITGGWGAEVGTEGLLSQTVDAEVSTPGLVIDGFELVVERGEHERPPYLVHPLRREDSASAQSSDEAAAADSSDSSGRDPG